MTDSEDHQSPTLFAEQSLLGAVILDGLSWDLVSDKLTEAHFTVSQHRDLLRAFQSLAKKDLPIDLITVENELKTLNAYEERKTLPYLGLLCQASRGSANIAHYSDILIKEETVTRLKQAATQISLLATARDKLEPSEMIDQAESLIFQIQQGIVRGGGPRSMTDIMAEFLDSLENKKQCATSTGFFHLDELMAGGMRAGELIIIAGRPGSGKTTLGMNIAEYVARNEGVLIFSMEMTDVSLAGRIFASMGRIDLNKLRTMQLSPQEWETITQVVKQLSSNHIGIDATPNLKPSELRARARREMRSRKNIKLIVVDYLQLMRGDNKHENRNNEMGEVSSSLKALAKELNVPIIALAQLNRGSVNRVDKRPTMADLRDSGAFEQDADVVALIYRDELYNANSEDKGLAEIIVDKQRNGETGSFKLMFIGKHNSFVNYKDFRT